MFDISNKSFDIEHFLFDMPNDSFDIEHFLFDIEQFLFDIERLFDIELTFRAAVVLNMALLFDIEQKVVDIEQKSFDIERFFRSTCRTNCSISNDFCSTYRTVHSISNNIFAKPGVLLVILRTLLNLAGLCAKKSCFGTA